MEALRVGSFIYTMGECVKEMMSDACTEKGGYLEMYILAGKQMAYYHERGGPQIFIDTFYDYTMAGNAPMAIEAIRTDLSRFKTIGEVAAYLSTAMLAGFE